MTLTYDDYDEKWRYERLSKVAQIMAIVNPELQDGISNLHDHEGILTITWHSFERATKDNQSLINDIWGLLNECATEHTFI